jgi:hypothetical protein
MEGETENLEKKYLDATLSTTYPTCPDLESNPGSHNGNQANNNQSHGKVHIVFLFEETNHDTRIMEAQWHFLNTW